MTSGDDFVQSDVGYPTFGNAFSIRAVVRCVGLVVLPVCKSVNPKQRRGNQGSKIGRGPTGQLFEQICICQLGLQPKALKPHSNWLAAFIAGPKCLVIQPQYFGQETIECSN